MTTPFAIVDWNAIAAMISAMADVITIGRESYDFYLRLRHADPSTAETAEILAKAFSSYSPDEIAAIENRITRCRDRFIQEGAGEARRKCFCSVLRDVRDGNGGTFPNPEWERTFTHLNCP